MNKCDQKSQLVSFSKASWIFSRNSKYNWSPSTTAKVTLHINSLNLYWGQLRGLLIPKTLISKYVCHRKQDLNGCLSNVPLFIVLLNNVDSHLAKLPDRFTNSFTSNSLCRQFCKWPAAFALPVLVPKRIKLILTWLNSVFTSWRISLIRQMTTGLT